jgi:hypothetical protein
MDGGGGEALLVRRSKPKKRPAPAEPHAEGREFGGGNRFLALWRDYHDLLQVPNPPALCSSSIQFQPQSAFVLLTLLQGRPWVFEAPCKTLKKACYLRKKLIV